MLVTKKNIIMLTSRIFFNPVFQDELPDRLYFSKMKEPDNQMTRKSMNEPE
jgi:hypothetical protein